MSHNERTGYKNRQYESLHKTVIVNDRMKPIRVITPIIVIIMIITVMCVYTYYERKNIIENAEQITNQMAEYIAGNIANDMDYAMSSIKFASATISRSMASETLEDPTRTISPMVANSPFDRVEYITADGMNIMTIGEPFDARDRVYYIEGMKGNTGIWNNFHPKTSQETLMNFYTPIFYQGKVSGVLTGYIAATKQISPLFETKLYGQDIYGLLVDENDMVICSTIKTKYIKDLSLDKFMSHLNFNKEQKQGFRDTIHSAKDLAASYKDPSGQGRISVTTIPGTDWKVVIVIPETSFNAIVSKNTRDSLLAITVITLILISYASFVLIRNIKRRKEIALENAKLEEENRIFNEENILAFKEISAIRDINASANMGTWRIELVEDQEPRMYVDDTMKSLLGVSGRERSPEETYKDWFDHIAPPAIPSVLNSIEKMKQGKFDENTYLWIHPSKGERYVRCGGTAQRITGGFSLSGYHYDVDEVVREDLAKVLMLQEALNEKNDYYNTLGTLAGIYNSLHVIDLVDNTFVEFSAKNKFRDLLNHNQGAADMVAALMTDLANDECRESALEYTDLKTLADRMQYKDYISTQLVSDRIGWFLANFISMETNAEGRPQRVIFTTQSIDEEKKLEESLIHRSRTDELTGLLNRRAYEEDIYAPNVLPAEDSFVFMSLDVDGLKHVNDTLGHAAGDELLVGASQCMKRSLGSYGQLYRTGGDEFIAILFCDHAKLKELLADFEETTAKWTGELNDSLSISYGYVTKEEEAEMSLRELGALADRRMYEAKSAHYRKTGVDREGHYDAHRALCDLYTKILRINISDDSYQIINMDKAEQTRDMGFSDSISSWLQSFGTSGQVHPDDLQEYLHKTDLSFMRDYFAGGNGSLNIIYRRKYEDTFKLVMMEIIPAYDYSEENQTLYLYVKYIDIY